MGSNTTKLYGDGKHRKLQVRWDGIPWMVRFDPPDHLAYTEKHGSDLPAGLAEKLLDIPGTYVRLPGGVPMEGVLPDQKKVIEKQEKLDKLPEEANKATPGSDFTRPNDTMTIAQITKIGRDIGMSKNSMKKMVKADLLGKVDAKCLELYPGLVEH